MAWSETPMTAFAYAKSKTSNKMGLSVRKYVYEVSKQGHAQTSLLSYRDKLEKNHLKLV